MSFNNIYTSIDCSVNQLTVLILGQTDTFDDNPVVIIVSIAKVCLITATLCPSLRQCGRPSNYQSVRSKDMKKKTYVKILLTFMKGNQMYSIFCLQFDDIWLQRVSSVCFSLVTNWLMFCNTYLYKDYCRQNFLFFLFIIHDFFLIIDLALQNDKQQRLRNFNIILSGASSLQYFKIIHHLLYK